MCFLVIYIRYQFRTYGQETAVRGMEIRTNLHSLTTSYTGSLNYFTYPDPFQNMTMYHKHHDEVEDLAEGYRRSLFRQPMINKYLSSIRYFRQYGPRQ